MSNEAFEEAGVAEYRLRMPQQRGWESALWLWSSQETEESKLHHKWRQGQVAKSE